jgi:hypothetical protein
MERAADRARGGIVGGAAGGCRMRAPQGETSAAERDCSCGESTVFLSFKEAGGAFSFGPGKHSDYADA